MAKTRANLRKRSPPKRIAGIRIPDAARKGFVVRFLNSSAGQVLLAEAIVLVSGALGARKRRSPATSRSGHGARVTIEEALTRLSYAGFVAMKAFRVALAESALATSRAGAQPAAAIEAKPVFQIPFEESSANARKRPGTQGRKRPRRRTNRRP